MENWYDDLEDDAGCDQGNHCSCYNQGASEECCYCGTTKQEEFLRDRDLGDEDDYNDK